MDYIVNYNVNNVGINCILQEKESLIGRLQKDNEELMKTNQLLLKDNERLKADLDLQKKLTESLEKFNTALERNVSVLKDTDKNRWTVSDAESEVSIWGHEFLMIKRMVDKREREETQAILLANNPMNANLDINALNNSQNNTQTVKQSTHRRSANKTRISVLNSEGTAIKRYVCDYANCNYSSNWAHDLKGHKRKHTGEKPYTCGWLNCNKSFRDLRDLKRHQRAHTGDKRYSCDWPGCDYRSTDVANLAKHKRTHTGERPYKCDWNGCEKSFADGSHLKRHQKKHENQVSKLTKSGATKRRQTTPKSSSLVKTRQQPGRKAKGSNAQLALETEHNDKVNRNEIPLNTENKSSDRFEDMNNVNESQENIELNKELNKNDCNQNQTIGDQSLRTEVTSVLDSIASEVIRQPNDQMVDSNIVEQTDSCVEESNRTDMGSSESDGQNLTLLGESNRLVVLKNPIVITSAMIEESNKPLEESADKVDYTIVRYSDIQRL